MSDPAVHLAEVLKPTAAGMALGPLSASIPGGGPVALLGPSGAGTTTLLRLIAGLTRPRSGRILVLGRDAVRTPGAIQAIIGYMPQRAGLHDALEVGEALRLHAALRGLRGPPAGERVEGLLERIGLAGGVRTRIGSLSPLERERLGLACAVIARPPLLLLDKPGHALDPAARRDLLALARELAPPGCTLILSTESFVDAERCAEVLLLDRGRLLAQGAPAMLAGQLAGRAWRVAAAGLARRAAASRLRALPFVQEVAIEAAAVRVIAAAPVGAEGLAALAEIGPVTPATATLEDCFASLGGPGNAVRTELRPAIIDRRAEPALTASRLARMPRLSPCDLSLLPGEIVGLIGAPGSGRTTLLRLLCGLETPSQGCVSMPPGPEAGPAAGLRRRIGYMPAAAALYGALSVRQNLRTFAGAAGLGHRRRAARIAALLAELGLEGDADRSASALTPGQRQLLSFAVAMLREPAILLLDEPTQAADPITRRAIWRGLEALAAAGATILVATSDPAEAAQCDRLLVLRRGHVVASGTPDSLPAIEPLLATGAAGDAAERAA